MRLSRSVDMTSPKNAEGRLIWLPDELWTIPAQHWESRLAGCSFVFQSEREENQGYAGSIE
jgi:hypothetical protein